MANPRPFVNNLSSPPILASLGPGIDLPGTPGRNRTARPISFAQNAPLTPANELVLAQLLEAIDSRTGLALLTGEGGTGKTAVVRELRSRLATKSVPVAFIFNPLLDARNFFDFILAEFGVPLDAAAQGNSFSQLSNWLFARHREGMTPVLIIDEAQCVPVLALQALGFLLNLEGSDGKLVQVVLAGQLELNDKLRMHDARQLLQQIGLRCATSRLNLEETHAYVEKRIGTGSGAHVFSIEALDSISRYSGGIPRVINLLCEHALAETAQQAWPVPSSVIENVARDFQFDDVRPFRSSRSDHARRSEFKATPDATPVHREAPPASSAAEMEAILELAESVGRGVSPTPKVEIKPNGTKVSASIAAPPTTVAPALLPSRAASVPAPLPQRSWTKPSPWPSSLANARQTLQSRFESLGRIWCSLRRWLQEPMRKQGRVRETTRR